MLALLHDSAEAYLPDIPTPLKHNDSFAWFRHMESHIQDLVFRKFVRSYPDMCGSYADADREAFLIEWHSVMPPERRDLYELPKTGLVIPFVCWSPDESKSRFIRMFDDLHKESN